MAIGGEDKLPQGLPECVQPVCGGEQCHGVCGGLSSEWKGRVNATESLHSLQHSAGRVPCMVPHCGELGGLDCNNGAVSDSSQSSIFRTNVNFPLNKASAMQPDLDLE